MTEIQKTISRYLRASAGTANHPTEYCFRCFVGMLETGEATLDDFAAVGGDWLRNEVEQRKRDKVFE